jgi:hypothetical protein
MPCLSFTVWQDRETVCEARAVTGMDLGVLGLVKGGIEYQRDVEALAIRF